MSDEERALLGEIDRAMMAVPRSPWKVALNRFRGIRNSYLPSSNVQAVRAPFAVAVNILCQRHVDRVLKGQDLDPVDLDAVSEIARTISAKDPTPATIKTDLQKAAVIREEQKVATAEREAKGIGRKLSPEERDKAAQASIVAAIAAKPEGVTKQ